MYACWLYVEAKVNVRSLPRMLDTVFFKSLPTSRTQSSLVQLVYPDFSDDPLLLSSVHWH